MYDAGLYKVFSYAGPAIRKINEHGMKAVLITNQSGVGRGYFDEASVGNVHTILQTELAAHQAKRAAPHGEAAAGSQADPQHKQGGTQGCVDTWATAEACA